MALFKAVVRRPRKDGFWQVYIRVCVDRLLGYIATDKYVTGKGLGKGNELTDPYVLQYCSGLIIEYNDRLNRKDTSRWTVRQVVEYLRTAGTDLCFSEYARLHIDRMIDRGQVRNARNYRLALQHLERFCGTTKVMFDELTSPRREQMDTGVGTDETGQGDVSCVHEAGVQGCRLGIQRL